MKTIDTSINKKFQLNRALIHIFFVWIISIGIMLFHYSSGIPGNDFWWHCKVGEWISTHHKIPVVDYFSWHESMHHAKWFSHEWLSELFIYHYYNIFGDTGTFLFSVLLSITIITILIYRSRKYISANFLPAIVLFLIASITFPTFFYFRPHIFSFILLTITCLIMFAFKENPDTKKIYILPLLSIIWANMHGGSSNLIYVIPTIFLVSMMFDLKISKLKFNKIDNKNLIRLFIVIIINTALLIVNPHGVDMIIYPYTNMMDKNMLAYISEWATPDAKLLPNMLNMFIPIIIFAVLFISTKKEIDITHFFLFGFTTFLTLRSVRFVTFLILISYLFIFEYFEINEEKIKEPLTKIDKLMLSIIFIMLCSISVFGISKTISTYNKNGSLVERSVSEKFIKLIKKEKPQRIYNTYHYGELLIYNDIPVFIDGRADLYSGEIFNDSSTFSSLRTILFKDKNEKIDYNIVQNIIKKYNFDGFLVAKDSTIATYLYSMPDQYQVILEDKESVYFKPIN